MLNAILYDLRIINSINLGQGPATNMIFFDFPWVASISLFAAGSLLAALLVYSVVSRPGQRWQKKWQIISGPAKSITFSDSHGSISTQKYKTL